MTEATLRPAIFASSFHPHLGGVEELVRQLAHAEQRAGHDPVVITNRWPKDLPAAEVFESIPVFRHQFRSPERDTRFLAAYAAQTLPVSHAIDRQLRARHCDLVHVQCVSANGIYARRAARRLGIPLVVTLQGELTMDASGVYQRSTVLPKLLRTLMREADVVTACSRSTLDEAQAFTGVRLGERGLVIANGVDVEEFARATPARDAPYVLAAGRHVHQKGFDVLLDAWARLDGRVAPVRLVIAGDGAQHEQLVDHARDLGLGSVDFVGRCDRQAISSLFAGCTAFVLPSRHEPFGIVILEAMAAGKPVVATRVGGVAETVHDGVNGIMVDPEDAEALAAAIERVVGDTGLAHRLGECGRSSAASYDWANVAARYVSVYAAAIDCRNKGELRR